MRPLLGHEALALFVERQTRQYFLPFLLVQFQSHLDKIIVPTHRGYDFSQLLTRPKLLFSELNQWSKVRFDGFLEESLQLLCVPDRKSTRLNSSHLGIS